MSNSSFNPNEMIRLAQSLLDAKTNSREFMLEDVHSITRQAYEQYPEDSVITQVAFTIERMAEKAPSGSTISQAAISDIYNNFVRLSSNSKFREVLGGLLLTDLPNKGAQSPDYSRLNRIDAADLNIDADSMVDKNMVNAISAAFTGSFNSMKVLDNAVTEQGKGFVSAELKMLGFKPSVETMGGNPANIVYAAHFDTRKGRVTVAIPTQISNGRVLFPSVFVANDRFEELTATKLEAFIEKKSESSDFSVPNASDILSAVSMVSGQKHEASAQEFSELKTVFGEDKGGDIKLDTPDLFAKREYQMGRPDIDTRQNVEMPQELAHLSKDFEDSVLEAASEFGLESIRNGKEMVARELKSAGFKNAQVKFGSENDTSVVYLALINTPKGPAEIEVPIEMKALAEDKYVPLAPTYFAYDGLIEDFTAAKLQRFATRLPAPSSKSISYSSAMNYLLLPELKDEILKAASYNDYVTCEEALQEIQARFSEEDFKNALADYHYVLTQKARLEEKPQYKCSKIIHAGHGSISDRCGHLLVTLDKVETDAQGNCRLKSAGEREKLNPLSESGADISTSKIFMT